MSSTYFESFIDAFNSCEVRMRVLDGDDVLVPPVEDFGYPSTPRNALTFASMGVDGVHYAVLKRGGMVRDDSPVIQVSPMDSDGVLVLAESFLQYLAGGCGISSRQLEIVFSAQRAGKRALLPFIAEHFRRARLISEERNAEMTARYGNLIERK